MGLECKGGGAEGAVGAGVQSLPLLLCSPLGRCPCSLACGGASAVVVVAPTGVARTPALCIVHTHLSLCSFALMHLPLLSPSFVHPCPHPICPLACLPVHVIPNPSHTTLVSCVGPCCLCLCPLSFISVLLSMCSCLCSMVAACALW